MFLRTATKEDINNLKNSLSNFGGFQVQKQAAVKKEQDEDDYIEEEFEEHISSDNDSRSSSLSDSLEKR
jgi:hypothetical protein